MECFSTCLSHNISINFFKPWEFANIVETQINSSDFTFGVGTRTETASWSDVRGATTHQVFKSHPQLTCDVYHYLALKTTQLCDNISINTITDLYGPDNPDKSYKRPRLSYWGSGGCQGSAGMGHQWMKRGLLRDWRVDSIEISRLRRDI